LRNPRAIHLLLLDHFCEIAGVQGCNRFSMHARVTSGG
jgi:hypothetical protein